MSELARLPVAVPGLADVLADPGVLDRLPVDVLVALRGQVRHLDVDLTMAIDRLTATGGHQEPEMGEVLGIDEAAKRLGTSPDSLYRKRQRLRLGYRDPLDGRLKFTVAELEAYIRRQKRV